MIDANSDIKYGGFLYYGCDKFNTTIDNEDDPVADDEEPTMANLVAAFAECNITTVLPVSRPSPSRQSPTRPRSISKTRNHIPACAFCQCCIVDACFDMDKKFSAAH